MLRRLNLLVMLLLVVLPAAAQSGDEDHPLPDMLTFVPNIADVTDHFIFYMDFRAAEAAREADPISPDMLDTPAEDRWRVAITTASAVPGVFQYLNSTLDTIESVSGFAYQDIDRSVYFSVAPMVGYIFQGSFDAESIDTALVPRDFERAEETDNLILWCWIEGCDRGQELDFLMRDTAAIFGGEFGRREPRALVDESYLLNSAQEPMLRSMLAARDESDDSGDSVLVLPAYRAAVNHITQQTGSLRQVIFIAPRRIALDAVELMPEPVRDDLSDIELTPLPEYELLVLTDIADGDDQITSVLLVYADADDATTAHTQFSGVAEMPSVINAGQTIGERLTETDSEILPPEIILDDETEYSLVSLPLRGSVPQSVDVDDRETYSSLLMRNIFDLILDRDVLWLLASQ